MAIYSYTYVLIFKDGLQFFAIYRVDSFTRVLIFRVSCIRVLAATIVVYVFSCINIFCYYSEYIYTKYTKVLSIQTQETAGRIQKPG